MAAVANTQAGSPKTLSFTWIHDMFLPKHRRRKRSCIRCEGGLGSLEKWRECFIFSLKKQILHAVSASDFCLYSSHCLGLKLLCEDLEGEAQWERWVWKELLIIVVS